MNNLKIQLITMLLLFSLNTNAGVNVFVGPSSDSNCDFNSIQAAMDSGANALRISNAMQYNENLILPNTNLNISITGGYTNCTFGSFDTTLKSTISGHLAAAPVLIITPSSARKWISIKNMNLLNGTGGSGFTPAGGISMPFSNDSLGLKNTTVALNEGSLGGGIYIGNSILVPGELPTLIISNKTIIANNYSRDILTGGGGVFCENGRISIESNSSIKRNTTDGSGGGIYSSTCTVLDFSGTVASNDAEKGIFANTAKHHGGGIFAINNSNIQIGTAGGSSDAFGSIINNRADIDGNGVGEGGGIYATGNGVFIQLFGSVIKGNISGFHGGGIYAQANARVIVHRQSNKCWRDYKCNHIINNSTSTNNGYGGAIYFRTGATGDINSAYFEGNRADRGTAIYANDVNTEVSIRNATFFKNGDNGSNGFADQHVVMAINQANIFTRFSTFVDNQATISTFRAQDNTSMSIRASLIDDSATGSVITEGGSNSVFINCVVTTDSTLVGTDVLFNPVSFVDRAQGDLHLSPGTGAVDVCDAFTTIFTDIDGDARPFDDLSITNIAGSYDAGADEFVIELIFANGFED